MTTLLLVHGGLWEEGMAAVAAECRDRHAG
jgi:hypothetical protein